MSDQPKPATGEWTVRPVHKNDGTVWPGIGYISDGNRTYGSANWEEGKAIVAAINAALAAVTKERDQQERFKWAANEQLAAERERVAWCEVHRPVEPVTICPACECVHLSDQLATVRKKQGALPYDELESLYRGALKQLAAEREKVKRLISG